MKIIRLITLLCVSILGFSGCVPHTTGETEVGVRTVKFGLWQPKGVEDKVYAPGSTYFFLPFINDWKMSGVLTVGSGRPLDARVAGDPNRDGNDGNDRLPGWGRNAFVGPDYATTDMRLTRRLYVHDRMKLELIAESFNLFNRDNQRVQITDDGFQTNIGDFVQIDKQIGINYFPAHYRRPANFLKATDAYAPRQVQLALKLIF